MRAKQLIPFPRPPKYKAAILFNPGEPRRILPTPLSRFGHVSRDKSSDVQSLLALEELCQIAGRANSSWIRVSTSIAWKSRPNFRAGIFSRYSKSKVFVSRRERERKWRAKKRGEIGKRNGVVVIQLGCKIFIARECTNFLPFPPPFIKSSFFVSRFVRFHPREIVRKISFSRSERYLRSLSFRIKSPFHASEMFSKWKSESRDKYNKMQ